MASPYASIARLVQARAATGLKHTIPFSPSAILLLSARRHTHSIGMDRRGYHAMKVRTIAALLVLTLALPLSAIAGDTLPSETDLRAAYCLPYVKHVIDILQSTNISSSSPEVPELTKVIADTQYALRRLQLYLFPRLRHLDKTGLTINVNQAWEDMAQLTPLNNACTAKCKPIANKPGWQPCMNTCRGESPIYKRLKACTELSWLP